ncbi:hypothetical protein Scep_000119 [Stephania cephalantha]|uniref:Hexosyltransferase n=1 Tax=Stephania cephalantha TaxID=152367 RepID=A0AAP0L701_9MAGN
MLQTIFLYLVTYVQVMFLRSLVMAEILDVSVSQRKLKGRSFPQDCVECEHRKEIGVIVTHTNGVSGSAHLHSVKSNDLSAAWVWQKPDHVRGYQGVESFFQEGVEHTKERELLHSDGKQSAEKQTLNGKISIDPVKLKHHILAMQELREKSRNLQVSQLVEKNNEIEAKMKARAIARSKNLKIPVKGKYGIWRKDNGYTRADSTLKLMRDQIIMGEVYASIAKSKNENKLYGMIMTRIKDSREAIKRATLDAELQPRAPERAKELGRILSVAKEKFYDCFLVARKLRAMVQSTEQTNNAEKAKATFLTQLAAKTLPKPIHCLSLQLSNDYYLQGYAKEKTLNLDRLENPSLFHYAIFSDNVLATAVVVNSTVSHVKEPEKHVFHVVTDKLNFAAMKMWFHVNSPALETTEVKDYYFKAGHPSTMSDGDDSLKYRNPKYLSMLNHLRFYLPEVYPKLDKILFLDDDIVVQKDLTPLWSVNLQGMVNGAVETCKESFHRFHTYLNFSDILIKQNFDPNACGWAYGMNIFDLKEWKKRNITGIYHRWQSLKADRMLWKLGSLPPGLITFYNLTYPLDRSWHVLGLGYDGEVNSTEIENAGVVHYNGNYKPWLELAFPHYKGYWSKYVNFANPYLQLCNNGEI